jgi:type II secretory pathway pseudopilin PulG
MVKSAGMTLIELLVVVTIMMTALSIVGGLTIDSVRKASAQREVVAVYSILKKSSVMAFSTGRLVKLDFAEQQLEISTEGTVYEVREFDHLYFRSTTVIFNKNGVPNVMNLEVKAGNLVKVLDLRVFFNGDGMVNS